MSHVPLEFFEAIIPNTCNMGTIATHVDTNKISPLFWCREIGSGCVVYDNNDDKPFLTVDIEQEADIVPIIHFSNLLETDFWIGDVFYIKKMPFKIFSIDAAIALESIGTYAFSDEKYNYYGSDIEEIVDDWFDYFIRNTYVIKYDILDIYDIVPMPGKIGRYHIVNKSGVVRHNANGYGFTSPDKARNMLKYYASTIPIPEEDIEAYNIYERTLISF